MVSEKERTETDIKKLWRIIKEFKRLRLHDEYPQILEWATNYANDAQYFFDNNDIFSAFGAANYAYGFIDSILVLEGKKSDDSTL